MPPASYRTFISPRPAENHEKQPKLNRSFELRYRRPLPLLLSRKLPSSRPWAVKYQGPKVIRFFSLLVCFSDVYVFVRLLNFMCLCLCVYIYAFICLHFYLFTFSFAYGFICLRVHLFTFSFSFLYVLYFFTFYLRFVPRG